MLLNQKYEIFPNEEQKEMLDRWLQYCRQTYNSALLDKERKYRQNKEQLQPLRYAKTTNLG